ncbi:MAG: response regulator, partial [Thiotrichaceae bacterium]
MDGYEATREIRHYEKETRKDNVNVIALTANAMQGDREKCIDAGMDDYLTKPYTIETLHKALSLWLPQPLWLPEQEDTQPAETQSAPDSKNNGTLYNEPLHNNEPLLTNNIEKETNKEKLGKLEGEILFVDDSKVNQYVGKEILTKLGLDFEVVVNGLEAVNARKKGTFDLILMDCQMPIMDGYTATLEIRQYEKNQHQNRITIVALTANAMPGDREKCLNAGMDDYLAKPYTAQDLYNTLAPWIKKQEKVVDDTVGV